MDGQRIARGVVNILEGLGHQEWQNDPNLADTPTRVARMFMEWCKTEEGEVDALFEAKFPFGGKQLILFSGIQATGLCPHHLQPVQYNATVAYLSGSEVVGASKIARVVMALTKGLELQEVIAVKIADSMMDGFKTDGVAVLLAGSHGCIVNRGVKQRSISMKSYEARGVFEDDLGIRELLFAEHGGENGG